VARAFPNVTHLDLRGSGEISADDELRHMPLERLYVTSLNTQDDYDEFHAAHPYCVLVESPLAPRFRTLLGNACFPSEIPEPLP
jgi:hypothetical protein